MRKFESPPRALFFKSPRPNDSRIGELVQPLSETNLAAPAGFVLLGYPDDDGIRINYGRPGSREAPDAIRAALYKLTPGRTDFPRVYDLGNLVLDGALVERHEKARQTIEALHQVGHRTISLGGGHDYGYPDIAGFLDTLKKGQRAVVLNFDSHLDVRDDSDGPNSGSAFYRLLEKYSNFDLVEIGIQSFCNSRTHRAYAVKKNVDIYNLSESYGRLVKIITPYLKMKRPIFISIDIDGFSAAYAPGASASYASGLEPNEFMTMLRLLVARADVRGMGIYEVSPPLDIANRTSQFAATLAHTFLHTVDKKADKKADKKVGKKLGKK